MVDVTWDGSRGDECRHARRRERPGDAGHGARPRRAPRAMECGFRWCARRGAHGARAPWAFPRRPTRARRGTRRWLGRGRRTSPDGPRGARASGRHRGAVGRGRLRTGPCASVRGAWRRMTRARRARRSSRTSPGDPRASTTRSRLPRRRGPLRSSRTRRRRPGRRSTSRRHRRWIEPRMPVRHERTRTTTRTRSTRSRASNTPGLAARGTPACGILRPSPLWVPDRHSFAWARAAWR